MSSNQRDSNFQPNISGVRSDTFTGNIEPAVDPVTHELLTQSKKDNDLSTYKYTEKDVTGDLPNKYFSYTDKDGNWYIMKLTTTGARYYKGSSNYTTNWTNHLSLTYDYFYNIF